MTKMILGVDLCDDYSQISYYDPSANDFEPVGLEDTDFGLVPTVLCKKKGEYTWFIGQDAYRYALIGEGIMVDKLIKLVNKDGTSTIEGEKYNSEKLMELYLTTLFRAIKDKCRCEVIEEVTFTIQELNPILMECLVRIMERMGLDRKHVHIISHTESYLFYVISQPKAVWLNQSALFDLTENGLHYYEMKVIRGRKPPIVQVTHNSLEEGFNLDILESDSGKQLADNILHSCAERLIGRKLMSSVFLTGKGFEDSDWAADSIKYICVKRRVFIGQNLFAKGACYVAIDYTRESSMYPCMCICEGRLAYNVSMSVRMEGKPRQVILAAAGTNWYEAKAKLELIADPKDIIEIAFQNILTPGLKKIQVPLEGFPARPPRTTRIELLVVFVRENCIMVRVTDKGFGELFPATGKTIQQYFYLD